MKLGNRLGSLPSKIQLKVEQDPTGGVLYQKLGSHGNEFWSVGTKITQEPKVSPLEQVSQPVKQSFMAKLFIKKANFDMPALEMQTFANSDGNWDDPKAPIINEKDCQKTFDGIHEFFSKCYGITSIPLSYIIRKDITPKEGVETDWDDPLEQMIERAPHTMTEANSTTIKHPSFVKDN